MDESKGLLDVEEQLDEVEMKAKSMRLERLPAKASSTYRNIKYTYLSILHLALFTLLLHYVQDLPLLQKRVPKNIYSKLEPTRT